MKNSENLLRRLDKIIKRKKIKLKTLHKSNESFLFFVAHT